MSSVIAIQTVEDWNYVVSKFQVVVVDCFAIWCGPCKQIAPVFEEIAKQYANIKGLGFAKVDVDEAADPVRRLLNVEALPTFRVVAAKQLIANDEYRQTGGGKESLVNLVDRASRLITKA